MNALVYATFMSTFLVTWTSPGFEAPAEAKVIPDLLAGLVGLVVIGRFATQPRDAIQGRYVVLAVLMVALLLASVLANMVNAGAVFQAVRTYVMHIPLFLLPAVYRFSPDQVRRQLVFGLCLVLLQLPLSLYQRFVLDPVTGTGDFIVGSVGNSKTLTMIMLTALALVWALHLRGRIALPAAAVLMLALFVPTVINETTGTLFLLPLVLAVPLLALPSSPHKARYVVTAAAGGALMVLLFASVYNVYYADRWGGDVFNVFEEGRFIEYELRGAEGPDTGPDEVGRLEAVIAPFREFSRQPVKLLVGTGAGNVQPAPLPFLEGAYTDEYLSLGGAGNTIALLLWETGVLGVALYFVFLWMSWKDAWVLRTAPGIRGALGLGWLGILAMLAVASIYINVFADAVIMYAVAYLAGQLAAQRGWLLHDRLNRVSAPQSSHSGRRARPRRLPANAL